MEKYQISITETKVKYVTIEASSAEEAKSLIQQKHEKGEIDMNVDAYHRSVYKIERVYYND